MLIDSCVRDLRFANSRATSYSSSLDIADKFEIGRYDRELVGSSLAFFMSGVLLDDLYLSENAPIVSE